MLPVAALIVSASVLAIFAYQPPSCNYNPCDSLPLFPIKYETLKSRSPLTIFRSTYQDNNCSKVIYAAPDCGQPSLTGTAYAFGPDCSYSYSLIEMDNNTLWQITFNKINVTVISRNVFAKFNETSSAACFVTCAPDGIIYAGAVCVGKTPQDEADIQKFLDMKLKRVTGVLNTNQGCLSN